MLPFFRVKTNSAANDGKWHHICLVWTSEGGKFTLHKDLSRLLERKFSEEETIPGRHSCYVMALLYWAQLFEGRLALTQD